MTTFNFTAAETRVAMILVNECLCAMGGKRPSCLDDDPFTWVDGDTLISNGYSRFEAAGFFSSLTAKGFIGDMGEDDSDSCQTYVTTDGYRFIDTIWDANQDVWA